MKTNSKRKLLVSGVALTVALFSVGCNDPKDEPYVTQTPIVSVTSLDILNSGEKVTFNIKAHTYTDRNTTLSVFPWNSVEYYHETSDYKHKVDLQCNGDYIKCDEVTSIVCTRTGLGADYSDYVCDLRANGRTYPQNQKKMRISTESDSSNESFKDTLMTVEIESMIDLEDGRQHLDGNSERDIHKMFNVFTGEQGI